MALVTTKGLEIYLKLKTVNQVFMTFKLTPQPLVDRRNRIEVNERIDFTGKIIKPINKND